MRRGVVALIVGSAVLLASGRQSAAAAEAGPIAVDLRTFKFKVRDEIANLFGYDEGESRLFFYTNGPGETTVKIPADGDYEIAIKASCDAAQNERAKFKVSLDGELVGKETLLTADEPKEYKLTAKLKAGDRKLAIEFTNDAYKENEYDRNLFVHAVTLKPAK
jgi:Ca-dependent carbohydrate-binding module xylan-binding